MVTCSIRSQVTINLYGPEPLRVEAHHFPYHGGKRTEGVVSNFPFQVPHYENDGNGQEQQKSSYALNKEMEEAD